MSRVLIVDDRADNRYMLRTLLQGHGFEVEEASQGVEAMARAGFAPPDLVITDLLTPEMDGYTLLREWKGQDRLRSIPVIVYTATYTEPKDEELALQLGADAFLIKPTEPREFMECVRQTMLKVTSANESRQPDNPASVTLKLYNQVLVRKLESRSEQLEQRIAELCASQRKLERLGRRHAILSGMNAAIVHMTSREEFLDAVCRAMVESGGFTLAWIGLVDAVAGTVIPVASCGGEPGGADIGAPFHLKRTAQGPIELALQAGGLFVCNDVVSDPAVARAAQTLVHAGLRSTAACPVRVGADIVGVVAAFAGEKDYFDEAYSNLVCEIGAGVSFGLEHAEKEALRRQSEEELKHLNADLENRIRARTLDLMNTNEEMRTFSYSVSHDLRAPLGAISGFTGRVLQKYQFRTLDEIGVSLLTRVLAAAERMGQLTDDFLSLARVSQHEVRCSRVSLSDLSLQVIDALREVDRMREVLVTIQPAMVVDADPGLMRIMLENLIGNAWKFTSRTERASIQVGFDSDDGETSFCVRDNGAGFDMEFAGKLFVPFQRLHSAGEFEGSGIGLSIVRRIVTKHGGRIWAEAAPGQGAVFRFTLQPAPDPARAETHQVSAWGR
jgi:signal transduction histidine kinase/DNA-binding response OmpR family regulator